MRAAALRPSRTAALPLGHELGQQLQGCVCILAGDGRVEGIELGPELLGGEGGFAGAVDEWMDRGVGIGLDQKFLIELLAGAQTGAANLDVAIGVVGIAHAQATEAHPYRGGRDHHLPREQRPGAPAGQPLGWS